MNAKFLELDVIDLVVPSDDIDVELCETVSFPLPIPIDSVFNIVPIETVVQIILTETRVPIVPVETTIVIGDIVSSQANDMLNPPTMNENA